MSALALALASSCGEFRRGPYEPRPGADASVDGSLSSCGDPLGGACNPYTQTGCASGQSCVMMLRADGAVSTYCALSGSGSFGSRCMAPEACAPGLVCVSSQCRRLCCPGETDACSMAATGTTARCGIDIGLASASVFACGATCDWRASTCGANATCIPLDVDGLTTDCITAGPGIDGSPCRRLSDCSSGFLCVGDATGQVCREICDTATSACGSFYSCLPVENRPAGFGVCTF